MTQPKQQVDPTSAGRGPSPGEVTKRELWARSAGVCQYPGCGEALYRSRTLPWRPINLGEAAHNVAASPKGPRGDFDRSTVLSDDPDNLLLLCPTHHKIADRLPEDYREATLRQWKEQHESAVRHAASTAGKVARPLIVQATQIGGHHIHIESRAVVRGLLGDGWVPTDAPYRVSLDTQSQPDGDRHYWSRQVNTLRDEIRLCRRGMMQAHADAPIAVAALAEMPALIALGHALGDKNPLVIQQFTRHNGSWGFQAPESEPLQFEFDIPGQPITERGVAIRLGLTAPIDDQRVHATVGFEVPIVDFRTSETGTEIVRSAATITAFRHAVRDCLNEIEARIPRTVPIHVFPAMPASLCVALGSCVMPKVANPLIIYDAKGQGGPFRACLELPFPLDETNALTA